MAWIDKLRRASPIGPMQDTCAWRVAALGTSCRSSRR